MASHPAVGDIGDRAGSLRDLVERARRDIPFYRDHLTDVTSVELAALPTATKADLAGYGPFPLSSGRLADHHRVSATSGTTGPRLFVAYSRADWDALARHCARIGSHIGFGPGDTLLNLLGGGLWVGGPSFDLLAAACGAALFPAGPTGAAQVLEWLTTLGITSLTCTPSYLRMLVEDDEIAAALARTELRLAFVGGEGASPALRRQVCDAAPAGFRWQEMYGSTEVGGAVLGHSPPAEPLCGELNVATDEFVVELLAQDRDEPVAPGELGEITVTTFRQASPLIRYRTRDLAAAVDTTRDASGLPRITSVRGRVDDALKVRGALVYPGVIEEVVVSHLRRGAEWRVELHRDAGRLDVLTVTAEHDDTSVSSLLADALAQQLSLRPVVRIVAPGSLPRFSGKAARLADHRLH